MEEMNENKFQEYFAPVIVLVCICMVITLALAVTYRITEPITVKNQQDADNKARLEVMPEGDNFVEYDGNLAEGVSSCYIADNKTGMAVTSKYKGFGGAVVVMTGIDADGRITGVKVTEHAETPGLGTKAAEAKYLEQYKGIEAVTGGHINDDAGVDSISGATITSNAVYCAVAEALEQFDECGGVR